MVALYGASGGFILMPSAELYFMAAQHAATRAPDKDLMTRYRAPIVRDEPDLR
jgi:hypothetical protein